jgi:hypothetical protein
MPLPSLIGSTSTSQAQCVLVTPPADATGQPVALVTPAANSATQPVALVTPTDNTAVRLLLRNAPERENTLAGIVAASSPSVSRTPTAVAISGASALAELDAITMVNKCLGGSADDFISFAIDDCHL